MRLYRGLATPMITVAFYNAITFSVYEAALKRIKEHKQLGAGIHQNVLAGLASGLARVRYSFAYLINFSFDLTLVFTKQCLQICNL